MQGWIGGIFLGLLIAFILVKFIRRRRLARWLAIPRRPRKCFANGSKRGKISNRGCAQRSGDRSGSIHPAGPPPAPGANEKTPGSFPRIWIWCSIVPDQMRAQAPGGAYPSGQGMKRTWPLAGGLQGWREKGYPWRPGRVGPCQIFPVHFFLTLLSNPVGNNCNKSSRQKEHNDGGKQQAIDLLHAGVIVLEGHD